MSPVLSLRDLTVRFDDRAVLEHITFDLDEGESLAVIGPNGSGKTVLLRALLSQVPYEGTANWREGIRVGYVPQKIDADRHLPLTLMNLLQAKAGVVGASKNDVATTIRDVAISDELLTTPLGHLSGGQFQKALIAFALLGKPQVLLFDEPTASLDQPREEQIYELIHRLQDEHKLTVLIVSHELALVYRFATKVLCLNKHNVCFGEPEDVLKPETLQKLYGVPLKYYHHLHGDHAH